MPDDRQAFEAHLRAMSDDPAVGIFLDFLARDIVAHPDRRGALPSDLREEIERLTRGGAVNHDEPLDGAVEL